MCDLLRRVAAGYFLGALAVKLLARLGLKRHNERVTAKRRPKAMDKKRGNLATILVLALAYFFAAKLGLICFCKPQRDCSLDSHRHQPDGAPHLGLSRVASDLPWRIPSQSDDGRFPSDFDRYQYRKHP